MWGGKGLYGFCVLISAQHQGQELKAGTKAEATEEHRLLAYWGLTQPAFLYNSRRPAQGWHCPHWSVPFHSIVNQENVPKDVSTGQSGGGYPSLESPSSQMSLACVQTEKLTGTRGDLQLP